MNDEENVIITSLPEYISKLEEYNLYNHISRGEDKKYDSIISSIFRSLYSGRYSYHQKIYTSRFYNEVCNNLTEMQRKHFLAFSQHHGIPTYLVDFTFSPLVSLYFACRGCYGINSNDYNNGYVHFISKDRLIDISTLINDNMNIEILNDLLSFHDSSKKILFSFYNNIANIYQMFKGYKHLDNWVLSIINELEMSAEYRKNAGDIKQDNMRRYMEELFDWYDIFLNERDLFPKKTNHHTIKKYISDTIHDANITHNSHVLDYTVWIVSLLYYISHDRLKADFNYMSLPFYCMYNPPNIDNRITNQTSTFIYQLFINRSYGEYFEQSFNRIQIQRIVPDITFLIQNKAKLLNELDIIGINEKYIFTDFDSIAEYINHRIGDCIHFPIPYNGEYEALRDLLLSPKQNETEE